MIKRGKDTRTKAQKRADKEVAALYEGMPGDDVFLAQAKKLTAGQFTSAMILYEGRLQAERDIIYSAQVFTSMMDGGDATVEEVLRAREHMMNMVRRLNMFVGQKK